MRKTKHPLPVAAGRGQGHEGLLQRLLIRPSSFLSLAHRKREVKVSVPVMDPELKKQLEKYKADIIDYSEYRIACEMVGCIDFLLIENERIEKGVLI